MNPERDIEPYWQDEEDWLCTIEFLPKDDPEGRSFGAETIGYLFGYAQLTNTRTLALIGDADAGAYELVFSFSSPEKKRQFLDLVRSNEDMGNSYVEDEFTAPSVEEIRNARPLGMVLPGDVVGHAALIALAMAGRIEDDRAAS